MNVRISLLLLCGIWIAGCSSSTLMRASSSMVNAPSSVLEAMRGPRAVSKMLCLWEAAEGQGLDEKPSRGFAGQILFFAHGEASPIKVKGKVRIFEYLDFSPDQQDPTPAHIFVFDAGAWDVHHTESTLGHSYNVFLPYVRKDKGHAVCALRVEIETEDGRKVSSPYTEVTLASRSSSAATSGMQRNIVKPASKVSEEPQPTAAEKPPAKLDSTTIRMPARR
jgi:hypothetical protein